VGMDQRSSCIWLLFEIQVYFAAIGIMLAMSLFRYLQRDTRTREGKV
jgi:hypothetical protein